MNAIRVPCVNMPSTELACRLRAHGDSHSRAKHQYVKCRAVLPTSHSWRFAFACLASACRTLIRPAIPTSRNAMRHMTSTRHLRCIACVLYSISLAYASRKPAPKTCKFRPSPATFCILSTCKPFFFTYFACFSHYRNLCNICIVKKSYTVNITLHLPCIRPYGR